MLVTLTPNPSIDRTLEIDELRRGEVLRASRQHIDPGGKGVNVARALFAVGETALAVLPVGGRDGQQIVDLLADEGVATVAVEISQPIRSNITVAEPDGTVTKLNEAGPELTAEEVDRLVAATVESAAARDATWIAGCGSLPPGAPDDLYATLVKRAHAARRRVAVDTSGAPLAAVIDAKPDLIKPNDEELAELVGRPLPTVAAITEAARELVARGVAKVLVSLGPDGALLVTRDDVVHAVPPTVVVASTVGAGDATLAGFLGSAAAAPADALADAVAFGAAAVALPGTRMPNPEQIAAARDGVRLLAAAAEQPRS